MRMPKEHRTPRADVINELVAVNIPNVRPLPLFYEERRHPDRFEGADRGIYAPWYDFPSFLKEFF